jgi:hypothetical protein
MAERITLNDALTKAISPDGAAGTRVTEQEYKQIRDAMPFGSSVGAVRELAAWSASDDEKALYAAVANSSNYADFCKNYQPGGRKTMGTWQNQ